MRFVEDLSTPRTTLTESRLAVIIDRIRQLAVDTDPDTSRRIDALSAQRDRLDAEIVALQRGEGTTLDAHRALDQANDILALTSQLPEDFARVRAELETVNQSLRAQLIEEPDSRGSVLEDIFHGVDVIAQSDAGRSFNAFHTLLLDPEQTASIDDDLDELLSRPFARQLTGEHRVALRRLLPAMQDSSAEISAAMTSLSRSLRRFAQTEQLAEEREVNRLLREALALANPARTTLRPFDKLDGEVALTCMMLSSAGSFKLHSPSDSTTATDLVIHLNDEADVGELYELARSAENDLQELTGNINEMLAVSGPATIGEILGHHPASQGVASVLGLMLLATEHVIPTDDTEAVNWSAGAETRAALIPRYLFRTPITQEASS